jgi:hypothetical protein
MVDIDGRHARDLIAPLFRNDNTELDNLIRKRLILSRAATELQQSCNRSATVPLKQAHNLTR